MVGTEMALPYLIEEVALSAVASVDSLLSLPDVRVYEKVFGLLLKIRSLATHAFLIQTRQPALPLIERALEGNINDFYRDEIEQRRTFSYPPFSVLVKVTVEGPKQRVAKDTAYLQEYLQGYDWRVYSAFTHIYRGKYMAHGLIKVPAQEWTDDTLIARLRALPPHFAVNVGPENTL
jgi:primosomal protein N'